MRRREFIAELTLAAVITLVSGAVATFPIGARAQQSSIIHRIGYLGTSRIPHLIEALHSGLRELGYVEGRNLKVEYRFGGSGENLNVLAAELATLGPDAIIALGTPAALAAKQATRTIPIVMAPVGDPVRAGLVASLSHPGGNITGATLYASELTAKRVELLKEAVPRIARLAVLSNAANPYNQYMWEDTQPAARALGFEPQVFMVREASELPQVFAAMQQTGVDAVDVLSDAMFNAERRLIAMLAVAHELPSVYEDREHVKDGGLMSYGPNIAEVTRHAAVLVDKVLRGANPTDLPIEQPTRFELVINLSTAKSLSLTISPSLLARADEVIE
jgi:putative tryptophan/tyrosine transport system substrate-binding protein